MLTTKKEKMNTEEEVNKAALEHKKEFVLQVPENGYLSEQVEIAFRAGAKWHQSQSADVAEVLNAMENQVVVQVQQQKLGTAIDNYDLRTLETVLEMINYRRGIQKSDSNEQPSPIEVGDKDEEIKSDWISVETQMPEDLEDVLGCHIEAGGVEKVYYSVGEAKWFPSDPIDNFERIVTHWQPLPPPPSKP